MNKRRKWTPYCEGMSAYTDSDLGIIFVSRELATDRDGSFYLLGFNIEIGTERHSTFCRTENLQVAKAKAVRWYNRLKKGKKNPITLVQECEDFNHFYGDDKDGRKVCIYCGDVL